MKFINIPILAACLCACGSSPAGNGSDAAASESAGQQTTAEWPAFNADSAYAFVEAQVAMGPRVPGTPPHIRCRDFIIDKMESYGADTVILQSDRVVAFNGDKLPMHNIIARFNTAAPRRILIAAHYDTRPWADHDAAESNHSKPIDGANDGASGVGVALELARNLAISTPDIGVDFLLTDVEDYGTSDNTPDEDSSWALGAQYFADNSPYTPADRPAYGILLDMVGGRNARFYREYFSEQGARWVTSKVWQAAKAEGITRFINDVRGAITDDHLFITQAGIPCIDIIECANPQTGAFPPTWHTLADNMESIDAATLGDVGKTLMRVIYTESRQ